jgi:short-subunit dehydrogenase
MESVKGKWALVTGASRGIGKLLTEFMAKQGCNLVLHSRNVEHATEILETVRSLGIESYSVGADLADSNEVIAMLDEIEEKGTQIDILFNNAAVQIGYHENYWSTPLSDFDLSFRINFTAVATICYRLMPKMIERGYGRIINTTSGIKNEPEQAGYSTSKAALDKFTTDLGSKLQGSNVIISLTDPGWCRTDMGGQQAPNAPESSLPGVAVGAFVNDGKSGRLFAAHKFYGMSLEEAVQKAATIPVPE